MKERELISRLSACFSDWDGDFDVDVEQDDHHKGWAYFNVIVTHRTLGGGYEFSTRVNDSGDCEMYYDDDSWHDITKANIFAAMWFRDAVGDGPLKRTHNC